MFIHSLVTPWTRRFHARPFDWLRTCSISAISFGNQYSDSKRDSCGEKTVDPLAAEAGPIAEKTTCRTTRPKDQHPQH